MTIAGRVVYSFLTTEGGVLGRKFNKGGEIQSKTVKNLEHEPTFDVYHPLSLFGCL